MAVTTSVKRKKKSWVPMYAPEFLSKAYLGESIVNEKTDLIGKTLTLNQSIFTRDMKKQSTEVTFRVKSVVDNKGLTDVVGLSLTGSYVKRLVRRGKSKVEDSFLAKTKDGLTLRIKPVVITNNVVNKAVSTKIRLEAKSSLIALAKNNSAQEFFQLIIQQKSQKELKDKLSKLYPLRYVDVRKAQVILKGAPMPSQEVELVKETEPVEEVVEAVEE